MLIGRLGWPAASVAHPTIAKGKQRREGKKCKAVMVREGSINRLLLRSDCVSESINGPLLLSSYYLGASTSRRREGSNRKDVTRDRYTNHSRVLHEVDPD